MLDLDFEPGKIIRIEKDDEARAQGFYLRTSSGDIKPVHDEVHKPEHYNFAGIECIDAIEASMSPLEFQGYLKGNVEKYVWRYRYKGGQKDLEKANWYLEKLRNSFSSIKGTSDV